MAQTNKHRQNRPIKIVLFGPESTGKTSLSKALADHYNTHWVKEFARDYLQSKFDKTGEICAPKDISPIVKGQIEAENTLALTAKKFLFCDTNLLQTLVYANVYFKNYNTKYLESLIEQQDYGFYVLTDIDTPWVPDDLRDKPQEREEMLDRFEKELINRQVNYMKLSGSHETRLTKITHLLDRLF